MDTASAILPNPEIRTCQSVPTGQLDSAMSVTGGNPSTANQAAARWFLSFIGLSLILIGALFIALMARSYLRASEMRDWLRVECVILESELDQRRHDPYSPIEYRPRIHFGYEWRGKALTSESISLRGGKWSGQIQKAEAVLELYPAGSQQTCLVNPDNPLQAVLKADSLAPLYSIWFPALFGIGGAGILIRAWWPRRAP